MEPASAEHLPSVQMPMSAPESPIDLELVAAFIDGRVTPAERERALEMLANSDAAFEAFVNAVHVQADNADAKVVPIAPARARRGLRTWSVVLPAVAAALLIAVLPKIRAYRAERAFHVTAGSIVSLVADTTLRSIAASAGWEQRNWSVTRGGPSALADSARDFRLGVRTVDLQVAIGQGDTKVADRLVAEMLGWVSQLRFSEVVASQYAELHRELAAAQPRDRIAADASAAEATLGELLDSASSDSFWFGFGKWCAGAELAAGAHVGAFFQSDLTTRVMKAAVERGGGKLAESEIATLHRVIALARPGASSGEFAQMRDLLQALIKNHGG
jgi:hypothetical protein